mmetsp:Transcript_12431/g.33250  ORF Transcript_12431/g.33250 Transcript_12431/m.33250 type:complete len:233 (+) Transcript_12431:960-1658(+)
MDAAAVSGLGSAEREKEAESGPRADGLGGVDVGSHGVGRLKTRLPPAGERVTSGAPRGLWSTSWMVEEVIWRSSSTSKLSRLVPLGVNTGPIRICMSASPTSVGISAAAAATSADAEVSWTAMRGTGIGLVPVTSDSGSSSSPSSSSPLSSEPSPPLADRPRLVSPSLRSPGPGPSTPLLRRLALRPSSVASTSSVAPKDLRRPSGVFFARRRPRAMHCRLFGMMPEASSRC